MDATFPGFPVAAGQTSERYSISNSLRSTLSPNLVNEALVAWSGAPVTFFGELSPGMWGGTSVADQNGFRVPFPTTAGMNPTSANPHGRTSIRSHETPRACCIERHDDVAARASTTSRMGGSWTQYDLWLKNQQTGPER